MTFSYKQIDSNKLQEEIRMGNCVDVQLSGHRGRLLKRLLEMLPPAGTRADKGTKLKNLLFGVPLALYVTLFHSKLMSVVSFYVLSKTRYEIVGADNHLFRFVRT